MFVKCEKLKFYLNLKSPYQTKYTTRNYFETQKPESIFLAMFIDRTIEATSRIKQMCKEQRLTDFQRNAAILTELKHGKRKKKTPGKCYGNKFQDFVMILCPLKSLEFVKKNKPKTHSKII